MITERGILICVFRYVTYLKSPLLNDRILNLDYVALTLTWTRVVVSFRAGRLQIQGRLTKDQGSYAIGSLALHSPSCASKPSVLPLSDLTDALDDKTTGWPVTVRSLVQSTESMHCTFYDCLPSVLVCVKIIIKANQSKLSYYCLVCTAECGYGQA